MVETITLSGTPDYLRVGSEIVVDNEAFRVTVIVGDRITVEPVTKLFERTDAFKILLRWLKIPKEEKSTRPA